MQPLLIGLVIVAILTPFGVWAVRLAKRQRGGAVLITGLLLIFGMNVQIIPPPPPVAEQMVRAAKADDDDQPEAE
ncbi:hypothetical protein [Phenylobacterium sp.]|uniref:hypothetical protein n=1 Tax=Phenylobacterium sp. TaxID=1871053 RepID=UPI0037CC987D